jgi:hypothetical protein
VRQGARWRRSGRRSWEGGSAGTAGRGQPWRAARSGAAERGARGGTRAEAPLPPPPHPLLSLNKTIAISFPPLDQIWRADMWAPVTLRLAAESSSFGAYSAGSTALQLYPIAVTHRTCWVGSSGTQRAQKCPMRKELAFWQKCFSNCDFYGSTHFSVLQLDDEWV